MVNVPLEVQTILFAFAPLFSTPVWQNACTLFIGAILSIGKKDRHLSSEGHGVER